MEGNIKNDPVNTLATDVAKVVYKKQICALIATLNRFRVPERCYTILDDRDESTCMLYEEGTWHVFFSERGQKTSEFVLDDTDKACNKMIQLLSENDEENQQMIDYYHHEIDVNSSVDTSSYDLYETIKKGINKLASGAAAL